MGLFTKLLDYFNLDNMKERSNQRNSANSDKIIIDMNEKLVPTPSSKGLTPSPNPVTDKEPTKDNISISNTDANKILSTNIISKKMKRMLTVWVTMKYLKAQNSLTYLIDFPLKV